RILPERPEGPRVIRHVEARIVLPRIVEWRLHAYGGHHAHHFAPRRGRTILAVVRPEPAAHGVRRAEVLLGERVVHDRDRLARVDVFAGERPAREHLLPGHREVTACDLLVI